MTSVGLGTRDLKAALAFVADAHDVDASEPLTTELLDRLTELVGCTYATYEEFNWPRRIITAYVACSNEGAVAFAPHSFELPDDLNAARALHGFGRREFDKTSDRFDRRQRERMRDEGTFVEEFPIIDRIGFASGDAGSAWLVFDSDGRDFDERDREFMFVLRPHVVALWRRAVSRRQRAELLAALERDGDAATSRAVVLYTGDGRIDHATGEAQRLLAAWFAARNGRLPSKLDEWAAAARPGERYSERRNGSVLTVEAAGHSLVTLTEHRSADSGLTQREREVLRLVAEGLTNAQIAHALWVAPSTVAKHLEQAYRKLDVHSRTEAVARLAKLSAHEHRGSAGATPRTPERT